MQEYFLEIEKGKKVLREKHINFTLFKTVVSSYLHNANLMEEDFWVDLYNSYAGCIGREHGFTELPEWTKDFFQEFNKKEHRIWLK